MAAAPPAEGGEEELPEPCAVLPDDALPARQELFDEIFQGCSADKAKLESLNERRAKVEAQEIDEAKMSTMSYGELGLNELHQLLNLIKTNHGPLYPKRGIFLDLGSGAGKACIAAGLLHPFEKIIGIESVNCLGDMAAAAAAKFSEVPVPEELVKPELEMIKGDFVAEFEAKLEPLAPQVTVALAVATAYGEEQLQTMAKLAEKMPDNALFVTYTQGLPESILDQRNWYPLQRRAVLVKQRLAKRGLDPDTVEIPELPIEEPMGWVQISADPVELPWGASTRFLFKREPPPQPPAPDAEEQPAEEAEAEQ
jgi:hypothetical protein